MDNEKTSKQCTQCKQTKPLEEYSNHPMMRDGKMSYCRQCGIESSTKRYALKKELTLKREQQLREKELKIINNAEQIISLINDINENTELKIVKIDGKFIMSCGDKHQSLSTNELLDIDFIKSIISKLVGGN
jgi:hypothetical protein